MSEEEEVISVHVEPIGTTQNEATLGWGNDDEDEAEASRLSLAEVKVEVLKNNLESLTSKLHKVFANIEAVGGFELQEVQVAVEISGEGGVNLIGSVKAGAKGAIQLTFKPPTKKEAERK